MKWSSASRGSARHASAYVPTANVSLQGKTAVITGASTGIGRASALRFVQEGARLVLADVQDAEGEALAQVITQSGGAACFVHADVGRRADAAPLRGRDARPGGRLDRVSHRAADETPGHARRVRRRRAVARVARGRLRYGRRASGRRWLHRHVKGYPRPMPRPTTITRV